mmetsp:Transcript_24671/g.67122  ORF Transcript_24671/g.67122 Transcript_24671/m.67122 type:complete len:228 (-) Transcript_24671:227-910(-)
MRASPRNTFARCWAARWACHECSIASKGPTPGVQPHSNSAFSGCHCVAPMGKERPSTVEMNGCPSRSLDVDRDTRSRARSGWLANASGEMPRWWLLVVSGWSSRALRMSAYMRPPSRRECAAASPWRWRGKERFQASSFDSSTPRSPDTICMIHSKPRHVPHTGTGTPWVPAAMASANASSADSGGSPPPPGKRRPSERAMTARTRASLSPRRMGMTRPPAASTHLT